MTIEPSDRRVPAVGSRQRGVALIIALIVLVALSLASLALTRSVDTSTAVVGNVAFSEASIAPANLAVEEVVAVMFEQEPSPIANRNVDVPAQNYYAVRQPGEDKRGIPDTLTTKSKAGTLARALDGGNGNEVRWVIERMCAPGISADPSRDELLHYCDMMPPKPSGTTTMELDKIELPQIPLYRLTVRVDGPRNTLSFVQVMLR
jgi:hypothetical protein